MTGRGRPRSTLRTCSKTEYAQDVLESPETIAGLVPKETAGGEDGVDEAVRPRLLSNAVGRGFG